jgi:hypothetical protein
MSASPKREDVRRRLEERYGRLEEARGKRSAAAILARFNEIDGGTQSGLVSIELFIRSCATSRPSTPSCGWWRLFVVRLGSGVVRCHPISTAMAPLDVHTCRL